MAAEMHLYVIGIGDYVGCFYLEIGIEAASCQRRALGIVGIKERSFHYSCFSA